MIDINDKSRCSGCSACASICPMKCIHMEYDHEGFYYPKIDYSLCVKCNKCEKTCPYCNDLDNRSEKMFVYGCNNNNDFARKISTSGGMFAAIAEYVLSMDGVVFGAGYNENMHVLHKKAESIDQIRCLQGSKYVQSDLGNTFYVIATLLNEGRYVFFTGTPCQVEGLMYFLKGKDTEKLITADIKCYGVPSPELFDLFQKYLSEKYDSKVSNFYFRDKKYGYYGVNVKAVFENGRIIEDKLDLKSYSKTMFSKVGLRRSCYSCDFTSRAKISDFTLSDIWSIRYHDKNMDDDKGTTCVEINSSKGMNIIDTLKKQNKIKTVKIAELYGSKLHDYQKSLKRNYALNEKRRKDFFDDMHVMPYPKLMEKHFADNIKNKLDNIAKPIINKIPGARVIFRLCKQKRAGRVRYYI